MARRKVMLPNWANTEEASKSVEMLNEAFEGLTQGELVINTEANNTLLTTLNENGIPVIFESSEMIDKRLDGFLESIHQHDNKDVLDGIDSEKVAAWDKAVEDVNTLTSAVTGNEKVVAAALNQIVESVGLDENGNSPLPGNISLTDAVSALSGSSHAHENKGVLDDITEARVTAWDAAKAGAISSAKTYVDSLDAAMDARVDALEGVKHTHTNKTVLDGIDSEKVAAWDKAVEDVNTLTGAVTDNEKVVATAINQIIESVGLDENCNSLLPGNISLTDAVSALSGSSHTHTNKNVLDGITAEKVAAWEAAEANASAYTDSAITALNLAETYAKKDVVSTLIGGDTGKSIRSVAAEEVAKIVNSADTRYDTLKEIADWIISDTTGAASMANDINALKAISADTRLGTLEGKSHSHSNKDLLETYTQTEANLADAVAKKHEHTNKAVLDGITEEKVTACDGALEAAKAYTDEKLIKIDCGEY